MKRFLLIIAALLLPFHVGAAPPARQAALTIPTAPVAYPFPGAAALINMYVAPKNNFDNAVWGKLDIADTTFATKTVAPDGTSTASKLIEDTAASAFHAIAQSVNRASSARAGVVFRAVLDVKPAGRTRVLFQIMDFGNTNGVQGTFDLQGGRIGVAPAPFGTGYSVVGYSITPIGNGFYRCIMDVSVDGVDSRIYTQILPDNGSGTAASSVQYTGDGASGLYIWQTSLLPKQAWSLGRRTFYDNFDYKNIDTANAQGPGFGWYVGNWPSTVHDPGDAWRSFTPTTNADLTISSSVLTIGVDRSTFGADIMSAAQNGAGQTFGLPAMFRCSISFNPANNLTSDTQDQLCWQIPVELLNGSAANNVSAGVTGFVESDMIEATATSNGVIGDFSSLLAWSITGSGSGVSNNHNSNFNLTSGWPFAQATWNSGQHVVAVLWFSEASNGVSGLRQVYCDGTFVSLSETTWAAATVGLPGASPSDPTGIYSISDNHHMVYIIGAGNPGRPVLVDFVDVWQP